MWRFTATVCRVAGFGRSRSDAGRAILKENRSRGARGEAEEDPELDSDLFYKRMRPRHGLVVLAEVFDMHLNRFANELHGLITRLADSDTSRKIRYVRAE